MIGTVIETLRQDTRAAWRSLAHSRAFATTAVLTLGAGLALCLVVGAVANAYLFRPLPYPDADRLYNIQYAPPNTPPLRGLNAVDWTALDAVADQRIAWDLDVFYLLGGSYPENAPGAWVTPGYVQGFGVRAALGRDFVATDFETGRPMVALISHRLWQSRFGGDPAVVGKFLNVYVSDRPNEPESLEIIGVTREDFWHVNPYTEVLAPLRSPAYPYMLRLRDGVDPAAAQQRVAALLQATGTPADRAQAVRLVSFQAGYVTTVRPVLLAVGAAAALVLLIACANVAVLMLVRGQRRAREIGVRVALGASRVQVVRLLLVEALWLGAAATLLGAVVAWAALDWLVPSVEGFLERRVPGGGAALSLDPTITIVAIAAGIGSTLLLSVVPAVGLSRQRLATGERAATDARGRSRVRSLLIGLEMAVSLTLLTGALLMTLSALRMLAVDFGFQPAGVMTTGLSLRQQSYPDPQSRAAFFERALQRVSAFAQGRPVALGDYWPLQSPPPRRFDAGGGATADGGVVGVSPQYFEVLGIRMREGRPFASSDRFGGEPVAIVSASLARRLWPSTSAIGQTLSMTSAQANVEIQTGSYRVVGVADDVRQTHADDNLLDAYVPLLQDAGRFTFLYLPGAAATPAWERQLREAIAEVDQEAGMGAPRALQAALDQERLKPRVLAWMLSAFAVFAALLALVGIYGVVAYAVRQREREIAVRIAVGADRRSVTGLFVRQGARILAAGVLAGVLGALGMGRILTAQLYGIDSADPRIITAGAVLLAAFGLAAIWLPARRASATDPAAVLKAE
jgi:putative ABC transport system permease protein